MKIGRDFRIVGWIIFWLTAILVLGEVLLSHDVPWRYSSLEPYMLRDSHDSWINNAFEIQRIKRAQLNEKSKVVMFLGGSVGLEAITDDSEISLILSEQTGQPVYFSSLCASYKSFSDEIKLIEKLEDTNATILITTEILRFKTTPDKQLVRISDDKSHIYHKYFFIPTSDFTKNILKDNGLKVGVLHSFRLFRTAQVLGEIIKKKSSNFIENRGRLAAVYHQRHLPGEPVDKDRQRVLSEKLAEMLDNLDSTYPLNLQLFEAAIDKAIANGNRVVLVDTPLNPLFYDQIKPFQKKYDDLISAIVAEKKLGYLDLRNKADWRPEDFRDLHHMLPSGRQKFSLSLSKSLDGLI